MSVLLIAGSPSERSRSASLLDTVQELLGAARRPTDRLLILDLLPKYVGVALCKSADPWHDQSP